MAPRDVTLQLETDDERRLFYRETADLAATIDDESERKLLRAVRFEILMGATKVDIGAFAIRLGCTDGVAPALISRIVSTMRSVMDGPDIDDARLAHQVISRIMTQYPVTG
jgi:hypothetical protein